MTGSSVLHVNLVSSVAVVRVPFNFLQPFAHRCQTSLILHASVKSRFRMSPNLPVEWFLLVAPMLLSMTVFAFQPLLLSGSLLLAAGLISFLFPGLPEAPLLSNSIPDVQEPSQSHSRQRSDGPAPINGLRHVTIKPLPALTVYRSHMMLMTILAILAVDFPAFPRALAKCETFGVSLVRTRL